MMTTLRRMRTRGIASVEWVIIAMVVGIGGLVAFREFKDRYLQPTTERLGDCVESAAGDGEFCGGGGNGRAGAAGSGAATGQAAGGDDPAGGAGANGAGANGGGAAAGAQQPGGAGTGGGAGGAGANGAGAGGAQGGAVTAPGAGGGAAGYAQGGLTAEELVGATQANPANGAQAGAGAPTGHGAATGQAAQAGHGAAGDGHARPGLNAVADIAVDLFGWGVKVNLANRSYEFYRAAEFGVGPGAVRVVGSATEWSTTVTAGVVYGASGYSQETGAFAGTGLAGEMHAGPVHVGASAGVEGGANREGVYGALTNGGQIAGVGYDIKVGIRYVGDWTAPFRNAGHAISTWFFPPGQQPVGPPGGQLDQGYAMYNYMYMLP